jgi:hypothetical protein
LREHRGDGHVAVLAAEGIDGLESHVLRDAADNSRASIMASRGWTDADWDGGVSRLVARGLLASAGGLTVEGAALRAHVEQRTDELAGVAYRDVAPGDLATLSDVLRPLARGLVPAAIPYPNPVGAPRP